jgi:hypothetical protein
LTTYTNAALLVTERPLCARITRRLTRAQGARVIYKLYSTRAVSLLLAGGIEPGDRVVRFELSFARSMRYV